MRDAPGFAEFVAARSPALLRSAWLLTGDWAAAEDLLQIALTRVWPRWSRVCAAGDPEPYVRRTLLNAFLSSRGRRWHGEIAYAEVPDGRAPVNSAPDDLARHVSIRQDVLAALATLPPRQRAVVVLRYYDDLTESQAATALGVTIGTVKSQTAKAFASLRKALSAQTEGGVMR